MGEAKIDYETDPDRYVASFCRIGGHERCHTQGIFRCACPCHREIGADRGVPAPASPAEGSRKVVDQHRKPKSRGPDDRTKPPGRARSAPGPRGVR